MGRDRTEIGDGSRIRPSRALSARVWIFACTLKALGSYWSVAQGSDLVRTVFWMPFWQPHCGGQVAQAEGREVGRMKGERRAVQWEGWRVEMVSENSQM